MKQTTFITKAVILLIFSALLYAYAPHIRSTVASASVINGASAPPGCGLLAPANTSNCLQGQDYTTCTVVNPTPGSSTNCNTGQTSAQLKSAFITNLNNYLNSSQPSQSTSAAWIETQLSLKLPPGMTWQQAIMQKQYTLQIQYYPYSINTEYVPTSPNSGYVQQYTTPLVNEQSLVIYLNGIEQFAIKLDCGNPVGTLNSLTVTTPPSIGGKIYYHNATQNTNTFLAGVPIIDNECNFGYPVTNTSSGGRLRSVGSFTFNLQFGTNFCVAVPSSYTTSNKITYSNPVITPGYILGSSSAPPGTIGNCNGFTQWYRLQIAGSPSSTSTICSYGNVITDQDYNIAYQSSSCVPTAANNYCCTTSSTTNCCTTSSSSNCCTTSSTTNCCSSSGSNCTTASPCSAASPSPNLTPINLPNGTNLPPGTVGSVPGSGAQGSTVILATPQDNFSITGANDQYPNPTSISWSPNGYNPNPFTLNNYNYEYYYPYDDHQTTVSYSQQFSLQSYAATQLNQGCYGGGTYPTCVFTAYINTPAGCGTGSTGCTTTPVTEYGSPYSYYSYVPFGGSSTTYANETYEPPLIPELCPRNFSILPPYNTDVTSVSLNSPLSTPDQPSSATINTNTAVQFTLPASWSQQVRNPIQVDGIQYAGQYSLYEASGQIRQIGNTDNQNFNIGGGSASDSPTYVYAPGIINHSYSTTIQLTTPLNVGDQVCAQFTDTPQSGAVDEKGNISNSYGSVDSSTIPSPTPNPPSNNDNCSKPVANYPYSRSYGNDVISGTVFSNSPSGVNQCNLSASIFASTSPDSGAQPRGSGSQFVALALNQISNFASAFLRSAASYPYASNGLSMANTSGNYGGYFNGPNDKSCPSVYNYYLNRNQVPSTSVSVTSGENYGVMDTADPIKQLSFSSIVSNNYINLLSSSSNSNAKIQGEHVIYINGNVYIPNNITYDDTSSNVKYDSSNGIITGVVPNLYVIASGNIYIGPNVTQLDGIYVAQNQCDWESCNPASNLGGYINTCADPSGLLNVSSASQTDKFSTTELYDSCKQQLTITGALIGHYVKLERTYASMRNSQQGEYPHNSPPPHSCQQGNGNQPLQPNVAYDCSAEIFDFNPINYLGTPSFNSSGYNMDSIISLPPVL